MKFLVVGGVWDGRLLIYNVEEASIVETFYEQQETITAIGCDKKQRVIVTGSKSGRICVYTAYQWQNQTLKCL
jgi:hypothetical protein